MSFARLRRVTTSLCDCSHTLSSLPPIVRDGGREAVRADRRYAQAISPPPAYARRSLAEWIKEWLSKYGRHRLIEE